MALYLREKVNPMRAPQPAILADLPRHARFLEFVRRAEADPTPVLRTLAAQPWSSQAVLGLGVGLVAKLGANVAGLRAFPALSGPGVSIPSTQMDVWIWLGGEDQGRIVHDSRAVTQALSPAFHRVGMVEGFKFDRGLDLTGYEDGTENPTGEAAIAAAISEGDSFVAVQQWEHDLTHFASLSALERDHVIGRSLADNAELEDAPPSAHVKRAAQEDYSPEAFMVRRSMPWADASGEGLMFVAFGHSFDAFESVLSRMSGQDDGIVDGLFRFSRPRSGSYFWCPPVRKGCLDLNALGM